MNGWFRLDETHMRLVERAGSARQERLYQSLEQRLLFDAASVTGAIYDLSSISYDPLLPQFCRGCDLSEVSAGFGVADLPTASQRLPSESTAELSAQVAHSANSDRNEIVFVDAAIEDYDVLAKDFAQQGIETILLNGDADGVNQIADELVGRTDVDAIHIISHGDSAELQLGSGTLTIASMSGQHAPALSRIQSALAADADILLYGCNFGAGVEGRIATSILSKATGADIAASTDVSGHDSLGGDWDFELQIGNINAALAISEQAQQDWQQTLGVDLVVSKDDGLTNVQPGDAVTYTITTSNVGTHDATNVVLTDSFPVGLFATIVADGNGVVNPNAGTITWNHPQLNAGDTISYSVTAQIAQTIPAGFDNLVNTISATDDGANGDDAVPENNTDEDSNTLNAAPDLSIIKTDRGATVSPGDTIVYDLTYTNSGNQGASGVFIQEQLPTGTTFDAGQSSDGWQDLGGGLFRFTAGDMAAGETRTIQFAVTLTDAAGAELSNTAVVGDDGANGEDPTPGDNTATDATPIAGGSIEGFVFSDANGNGTFDSGERPLGGVVVELSGTDNSGNAVQATATTDANGRYAFEELSAGIYTVRQQQPANLTDGAETSAAGTVVGNDAIEIALGGGQAAIANNFGEGGLVPSLISKRYFLASTPSGAYADVVLPGTPLVISDPPQSPAGAFETTSSGLKFRILEEGNGARPTATDTVTVHYRGWLPDPTNGDIGPQFDSSFDRGRPSTFLLTNVIEGWTEGLQLVQEGGTIELDIPPELGYGATGSLSGSIPPNATLRFVVELIEIG